MCWENGNVINVLGKLFCTTNHESDRYKEAFQDQQFKWGPVWFIHVPTMGGENVINALRESCTAIHVIQNCAEYNLA